MLSRRHMLALPIIPLPLLQPLTLPPAPSPAALAWTLRPDPNDRQVAVVDPHGVTRMLVPGPYCHLHAAFRLGGEICVAARFATVTAAGEPIELLAIAGSDRVLLVEPWAGQRADGAHFESQVSVMPDGRSVKLTRDGAMPLVGRTRWARQAWIDWLACAGPALVQAPIRAPVAGTWQEQVAARQSVVLATLTAPTRLVGPHLVAMAASWPWDPVTA